jgi:hypothetical protein
MAGTIVLVGGINDPGMLAAGWRRGLRWAGLLHRIEGFAWQQGWRATLTFADLWRTAHHRRKAAELADRLRGAEPPVHVIGHSAGTAIIAYALECFAPADAVTSAVFVGSGLSPGYDLGPVLARCRYGLLAIDSPLDWWTLGVGTTLLGTCDRRHGPAAGMVGFRRAVGGKYRRLRWSPRLVRQGWLGGHTSERSPWLAQHTLAAWVRQADAFDSAGAGSASSSG